MKEAISHFRMIEKPVSDEYPAYASMYMDLIKPDGKVLEHMWNNYLYIRHTLSSVPEDLLLYRYAPGKWTVKEILVHIIDDERIYAYRALRIARNDHTPLPGFDQDQFTHYSGANERDLMSIWTEYEMVRRATISLFNGLPEEALVRRGTADNKSVTVRALLYHMAGHEQHHFNQIKQKYIDSFA